MQGQFMPLDKDANMQATHYAEFFQTALSITPLLKGGLDNPEKAHFNPQQDSQVAIKQLYNYWQMQHPEAGASYWLTRGWTMLIWQPLYLAFIGVYATHAVPKLSLVGQYQGDYGLVAGFTLPEHRLVTGDLLALIAYSGQELTLLFASLREQFALQYRLRPGFVAHLLADSILVNLTALQQLRADLDVYEQAKLWFAAFDLPNKHLSALYKAPEAELWSVKRISCCMHYRRDDGDLCSNCPKNK